MALRAVIAVCTFMMANGVWACATCSGPADAPQTLGMNAAILTLFGVLCIVGVTVATFIGVIARRIATYETENETCANALPSTLSILES